MPFQSWLLLFQSTTFVSFSTCEWEISRGFFEILAARVWQFNHEFFYSLVLDLADYQIGGPPNQIAYHHHLFLLSLGRQEGSSSDKLGQDAPYTPNVDGSSVLPLREDNFGGSVPARRNVICQRCIWSHEGAYVGAGQTKVTNFEIAVRVYQQVARFQIAMQNATGVNVFETAQDLVEEKLDVLVAECLV